MTSVTGSRSLRSGGFSLLELLVVIFIIGLLSGVVVMNLPEQRGDQAMRRSVEQTIASLRQVRNQAVFSGKTLGLHWRGNRSEVVYRDETGWQPLASDLLSRPITIPDDYPVWLEVEGSVVKVKEDETLPQVLFLSDGQLSPFVIYVQNDEGMEIQFDQNLSLEPAS